MSIAKINLGPWSAVKSNCYPGSCEQKQIERLTKKNVLNMLLLTVVSAANSPISPCMIGDVGLYHS